MDRRRLLRRRHVGDPGLVPVGGQVRHENTQSGPHVIAERGFHARGRGQHRVNDEGGGAVVPARTVDVYLHCDGIDMNMRELVGWHKCNKVWACQCFSLLSDSSYMNSECCDMLW